MERQEGGEKKRERERETKMGTTGTKVNHDENEILFCGMRHNNIPYHPVSLWISNSIEKYKNLISSVQHCMQPQSLRHTAVSFPAFELIHIEAIPYPHHSHCWY